ncbi:MAG: putative Fe-S cluster assembly protein SufT [Gammaproteobacteria bacterium RIFCSPHIGHO2_12_FULL_37_14]|nr:MAG: putative Fe-S cluster assembly protein SufT [Gammaproteobacteria bacterium RIFCSPHIGHO2_12_FULL_37_14]
MKRETPIEVIKTVNATLIPSGETVSLQAGTQVVVTQALGNSYTVYVHGNLLRVAGKDGDALGLVILENPNINEMEGSLEDKLWEQMKTCYDPEIPVNIVDLGLVYECRVLPLGMNDFRVEVIMTLTASGCGMGPVLVDEIKDKLQQVHGVTDVHIELVFDPPWNKEKMSEVAKLQLGLL